MTMPELITKQITLDDDLDLLVDEINQTRWDDANEMGIYQAEHLRAYLQKQDTVFVACHEMHDGQEPTRTLLGFASARIEMKPYDMEFWLYVDEVDVGADHRRKGAGKKIMQCLIEIADEQNCEEVWLGTEVDNIPARGLYRSLSPSEEEEFVGYTFELD